jgi:hypothetical protein
MATFVFPTLSHDEKVRLFQSTLEHYRHEIQRLFGLTQDMMNIEFMNTTSRIFLYMSPLIKEYKQTEENNLTELFVSLIENRSWDAWQCAGQGVPLCFPEYVAAILVVHGILSWRFIQSHIANFTDSASTTLTVDNIGLTWDQLLGSIRHSLNNEYFDSDRGLLFNWLSAPDEKDEKALVLLYSINNVTLTDDQQQDILCLLTEPSERDVQLIWNACMFGPQQYFASAHFNPSIFTLDFCKRWLTTSSLYWPIVKKVHCITQLPRNFESTKAFAQNRQQYVGDDLWNIIGIFMDPLDTLFDDVAAILPIHNANVLGRGLSIFCSDDWDLLTEGAITAVSHFSKKYELLEACLRNAPVQTLHRLKALGYTGVMNNGVECLSEHAFVAHTIVTLALTKPARQKEVKTFVVKEWGQLLRQIGRSTGPDRREHSLPPGVFAQSYTFFQQLLNPEPRFSRGDMVEWEDVPSVEIDDIIWAIPEEAPEGWFYLIDHGPRCVDTWAAEKELKLSEKDDQDSRLKKRRKT